MDEHSDRAIIGHQKLRGTHGNASFYECFWFLLADP